MSTGNSKEYETFATRIWWQDGQRFTERKRLQIPLVLARRQFEKASDLQIRECANDLLVELLRREGSA